MTIHVTAATAPAVTQSPRFIRNTGALTTHPARMVMADRFLLHDLPAGSRVLDVCCGTGEFLLADARNFRLPAVFDGALCTFDSLSYFQQTEDLAGVLRNVHDMLRPGASFVFDLSPAWSQNRMATKLGANRRNLHGPLPRSGRSSRRTAERRILLSHLPLLESEMKSCPRTSVQAVPALLPHGSLKRSSH
ncbi:MAG: class I SAM-dependent methyltransferase [Bryobacteraceae bacterium]|nr:class I SAM-dependent methyltransferase [Bryobacteraceae bacterium]